MAKRASLLHTLQLLTILLLTSLCARADARFDLVGPKIDVRVTRISNGVAQSLPIAQVPNLLPGDKIWLHPDLPPTQSVHYLLICVFLRGTTNPPPDDWFIRIPTWDRHVREEGTTVTVPAEAQQAVLFLAPETNGDFSTLRSAVKGRPGIFVRAAQDLNEAGFEQARIEKYLASIRRVPPSDAAELQKHSDLLSRTLALKPNPDCFKRPVDTQFTCLTQTGTQTLLDDGHGQTIVAALSNGPSSDFLNAASNTRLAGGGVYSAYVGTIVDLVRIMGNLVSAQYQYIPAIAFPQAESLNLRLNTPPSFHNPKSVIVIGLPAVQAAAPPPLRPADANHVSCLLEPSVTLPIEGAPLVFSTAFAHELVLHLETPPGAPTEPDIPLTPDAYYGGLLLNLQPATAEPHRSPEPLIVPHPFGEPLKAEATKPVPPAKPQPKPTLLSGTIRGFWGFDAFTGPTLQLQQLPGAGWHIVTPEGSPDLIAGHATELTLASTGAACVHTITARPTGAPTDLNLPFKSTTNPETLTFSLPLDHATTPGDLHLAIQQFGYARPDTLSARTFAEAPHIASIELHAADKTLTLTGARLSLIDHLTLGDLTFSPLHRCTLCGTDDVLQLSLPADAPAPPTKQSMGPEDHLTARITLLDTRTLTVPVTILPARPTLSLLRKTVELPPSTGIALSDPNDLPLNATLTFTLKSPTPFPRTGQIEIETLDATLRTVLTLAPSGGLVLQDPHTLVATLDPLRSFGPSAFGALHLRALYPPAPPTQHSSLSVSRNEAEKPASPPADTAQDPVTTDWLPLANLVRLPTLTILACPADDTLPCTLTGTSLYLLDSLSTDPAFATPIPVPDGFTGTTLAISPHPSAATLYLRLRDDPTPINTANLPVPTPAPAAKTHSNPHPATPALTTLPAQATLPTSTPGPAPAPTPTPSQPSPATTPAPVP